MLPEMNRLRLASHAADSATTPEKGITALGAVFFATDVNFTLRKYASPGPLND